MYSHSWTLCRPIPDPAWELITQTFRQLWATAPAHVPGVHSDRQFRGLRVRHPSDLNNEIRFDPFPRRHSQSLSMVLMRAPKHPSDKQVCLTYGESYDLMVRALLLVAENTVPDLVIHSDDDMRRWQAARLFVWKRVNTTRYWHDGFSLPRRLYPSTPALLNLAAAGVWL